MNEVAKKYSIVDPFAYNVIYVFRINDESHNGLLKIGDTTLRTTLPRSALTDSCDALNKAANHRIREYVTTASVAYELLYTTLAIDEKGRSFRDYKVHRVLKNSGIPREAPNQSKGREWFRLLLCEAKSAIDCVKKGQPSLTPGDIKVTPDPIILRPEQRDAVDMTRARFEDSDRVLWNAKMRFGKTVSALTLAKEAGFKKTIVITHRPAVKDGWRDDFKWVFAGVSNARFITAGCGNLKDVLKKTDTVVYFASIQDLRGSVAVEGKFNKNDDIFSVDWDFVIVDEAHEGVKKNLGEKVVAALAKKHTKLLFLSGTPFNIENDFSAANIYVWDYLAEQQAKKNWARLHEGDSNPYSGLPEMRIFAYNLGELLDDYVDFTTEGRCFNFKEFFRVWTEEDFKQEPRPPQDAEVGKFVHERDMKKFIHLLRASENDNTYPFASERYREALKHTLWKVPGVKEASALAELLRKDDVFRHFEIINVAGEGDEERETDDALRDVHEAIAKHDYTITLTCGRLTTGVTVKEWTGVLFLAGSDKASASNYLQTIFRVQSPYTAPDGRVKEICYAFDFAPDRILTICPKMVQVQNLRMPSKDGDDGRDGARQALGALLNFLPVISLKGSELQPYNVNDIFSTVKRVAAEKAIHSGFADESIYNKERLRLENIDFQFISDVRGKIGSRTNNLPPNEIPISQTGMTEEERKKARKAAREKKKRELSKEEKEALERLKKEKKQRDSVIATLRVLSIRLPLMIYGADVDYSQDISISKFLDLIDDVSWAEFMPPKLSKADFKKLIPYYDDETFRVAGKEIRQLAKEAAYASPLAKVRKITKLFNCFKNPDKETVLTPWKVVNRHMCDTLGGYCFFNESFTGDPLEEPRLVEQPEITRNVFADTDAKILELNSKSGLYPLHVAYTLFRYRCEAATKLGMELTRDNQNALWKQVIENNLFVVCKSPMARSITRRTLAGFSDDIHPNLEYFNNLIDTLIKNPQKVVRNITAPSIWNKAQEEQMKINAIVGNPPYQISDKGKSTGSSPVYHHFVKLAKIIKPKYISMIMPARWFTGAGKGMETFSEEMLSDRRIQLMIDYTDSKSCFPSVDIAGGLCIFLWNRDKTTPFCRVINRKNGDDNIKERILSDTKPYIRYNEALPIVFSIKQQCKKFLDSKISTRKPFGLDTSVKAKSSGDLQLFYNGGIGPYPSDKVPTGLEMIPKWKLIISYVTSDHAGQADSRGRRRVLSRVEVLPPQTICTETYLVVDTFDTEAEARNCQTYMKTRFARFLIAQLATTQHLSRSTFALVPTVDCKEVWTDDRLKEKYGLTDAEFAFIERTIRPMD